MIKVFDIEFKDYRGLLHDFNISFEESELWLKVGKPDLSNRWLLHVSIRPFKAFDVLNKIIPILAEEKACFKLIKNQLLNYQLNDGMFTKTIDGKRAIIDAVRPLTIFPASLIQSHRLVAKINKETNNCKGPEIPDAVKIGKILYTSYLELGANDFKKNNKISKPPFKIIKGFPPLIKKRILGKYYIPIEVINESLKGIVYKGVNIKKMSFSWCIIKLGTAYSLEDYCLRDIRTRLEWQKSVLRDFDNVSIPKFIDLFHTDRYSCLLMELKEGLTLDRKVIELKNGISWQDLSLNNILTILDYYVQILQIVEEIHLKGYIHRDITTTNFIVSNTGRLSCIDFELTYSILKKEPNPPYLLGTMGYTSPQQMELAVPSVSDDIYSLGAVLFFLITGEDPKNIDSDIDSAAEIVWKATQNILMRATIFNCLSVDANDRPALGDLKNLITTYVKILISESNNAHATNNLVTI